MNVNFLGGEKTDSFWSELDAWPLFRPEQLKFILSLINFIQNLWMGDIHVSILEGIIIFMLLHVTRSMRGGEDALRILARAYSVS